MNASLELLGCFSPVPKFRLVGKKEFRRYIEGHPSCSQLCSSYLIYAIQVTV